MDNHLTDTVTPPRPWADLTYQEAFDTMLAHIRKQGKPAMSMEGICLYRKDGLKCAVGAVIPDSLYQADFDTAEWSLPEIVNHFGGSPEFGQFLEHCQSYLHDGPARNVYVGNSDPFLFYVEEGAKIIANTYDLALPSPPLPLDSSDNLS